jgi:CNT family concentrative nucleoside transporter
VNGSDIPFQGVLGILAILLLAWLVGGRQKLSWKIIATGLGLQFVLAVLLLKVGPFRAALLVLNRGIEAVIRATETATAYVFGFVGGGPAPFDVTNSGAVSSLAFMALPIVLVLSVLSALLWHWRVIPLIVSGFSRVLQKSFGLSGEIGFAAAASIFFGQVEAPLLIRAYLNAMSKAELFILMTCGMATVAGTVMGLYASLLTGVINTPLSHILIASVISAPAAIMLAIMIKPLDNSITLSVEDVSERADKVIHYDGNMDAIMQGTMIGLKMLVNIVATLIVFVALAALVDEMLSLLPAIQGQPVTLARISGVVFAPLMWLIGIPWQEANIAGQLMGTKTILNEFIAFVNLQSAPLSDYSRLIMTYALCGFANLGSVGIMIAGLMTICPGRIRDIIAMSPLSILSGTLATSMTAAIVGLIV